jgi:SNF2 family DNA or RNA helicase
MLVSLKAGGTGLNLTAADHVFLMDPWWNPAVEDQAADRVHRIGQTRPVVVHRIVSLDTVEEGILALHTRKRALSEVVMGGVGASEGLSRDDLLALLDE